MNGIQHLLFEEIKHKIPKHASFVDEVATVLEVSPDGVYRRSRSETMLRVDELVMLCKHFDISLDNLMKRSTDEVVLFQPFGLNAAELDFSEYLRTLLGLLRGFQERKIRRAIFSAKDIPVFHLFQFPELARFKMFFWRKTIFNDPSFGRFDLSLEDEHEAYLVSLCHQVAEKYAQIPTTEIWNDETAISFIKQIEYYYKSGFFKHKRDAEHLVDLMEEYFNHLRMQAEYGCKFLGKTPPKHGVENFELYYNNLILIDNVIHVEEENAQHAFLVYHSIEYLQTQNPRFASQLKDWLLTLTRKSGKISASNEIERNQFFMKILDRLDVLRESLVRG
ncbi:hypothetical protein [Pontibacter sp. G13]|uniref:hypothetical protein n=1 Tax=Pontibacter sp. G13 TaxID=3074898 RepID=UPI00288A38A0|nr:hypothetical protein [Pontibacter sp. G13]WNJ18045.1 hypothetical protein RJD25_24580 [Pontibacter sp. G13]